MFYLNKQDDILKGLQFDSPSVFIPWDTTENDVEELFHYHDLRRVTEGYYAIKNARLFNNLICNIGLHFSITLKTIEFFRGDIHNLNESFYDFQMIFEKRFGKPTRRKQTSDFESFEWNIGNKIKINHYVLDRFGLTEYLSIENVLQL